MAKLTKTQQKKLTKDILSKATKLYVYPQRAMSMKDYDAIKKIMERTLKRIG